MSLSHPQFSLLASGWRYHIMWRSDMRYQERVPHDGPVPVAWSMADAGT